MGEEAWFLWRAWLADEARSLGEWGLEDGALKVWEEKSLEGFGLGLAMLGLGYMLEESGLEVRDCLGEMLSAPERKERREG